MLNYVSNDNTCLYHALESLQRSESNAKEIIRKDKRNAMWEAL
jgi:hypothetical protein